MAWWDYISRGVEVMPNRLDVLVDPIRAAVETTDARAHLRVLSTEETGVIEALVEAAGDYTENYLGRRLVKQQVRQTFDRFPRAPALELYGTPLLSTTLLSSGETRIEVRYWPRGASTHEVFGSSHYIVSANREGGYPKLTLKANREWPTRQLRNADAVEIDYWVGYSNGTAAVPVPPWARSAVLLLVGHWFENREAVVLGTIATKIPLSAQAILDKHRAPGAMI